MAASSRRRSLYLFIDRMDLPSWYSTFDFPSPSSSSPQRGETTVAPQALYFMNHEFVDATAVAVAARPDLQQPGLEDRVSALYAVLFGRRPAGEEMGLARRFLQGDAEVPWRDYVQALLMANEFLFVD